MCSSLRTLFMSRWHTHSLCVVCLGARHAEAALEGADCPHCESLPLCLLRSRKAPFPLLLRRSGGSARGVRREIWWRDWRRASLYLHPHLSYQMTAPEFGSPPGGWLPSGSGRGVSLVFFRGSWCGEHWENHSLSFTPVWGAGGGDHSCRGQAESRLASRALKRTAERLN